MAITLDQLIIDLELNSSNFQRDLSKSVRAGMADAAKLEKAFNKIKAPRVATPRSPRVGNVRAPKIPKIKPPRVNVKQAERELKEHFKNTKKLFDHIHALATKPVTPKVNDKALTKLNKHLTSKQDHLKQVQSDFKTKITPDIDLSTLSSKEQAMRRIVQTREDKASFDPVDRKQLLTDKLSRANDIAGMPFEGILRGFFENTGKRLNDYTIKVVGDLASNFSGKSLGDQFQDKISEGLELVAGELFDTDLNLKRTLPQGSPQMRNQGNIDRAAVSIERAAVALHKAVTAIASPDMGAARTTGVLHRQRFDADMQSMPTGEMAVKQAIATVEYFKTIYRDFQAARAEYKKAEKQLTKLKPGEAIPDDLGKNTIAAVKKLTAISKQIVSAATQANKDLKTVLDTGGLNEEQAAAVRSRMGNIGRSKSTAERQSTVAQNRLNKLNIETPDVTQDVASGLSSGIEKDLGSIKETGKKIGKHLEKGTKDSLDIQSPSRVFERIGRDIIRGLRVGLNRESDQTFDDLNNRIKTKVGKIGKDAGRTSTGGGMPLDQSKAINEKVNEQVWEIPYQIKDTAVDMRESIDGLGEVANKAFERLPAKTQRSIKRAQKAMAEGVVPEQTTMQTAFDRGNDLLVSKYKGYAATLRRNALLAVKAGDKVIAEYQPKIQAETQTLIDSTSNQEDVAALARIRNLLKEIRVEQAKVKKESDNLLNARALKSINNSAIASLKEAQRQGLPPELQQKATTYIKSLQSDTITPGMAEDITFFFKNLSSAQAKIGDAVAQLTRMGSTKNIDKAAIKRIIRDMKALGMVDKDLAELTKILEATTTSGSDVKANLDQSIAKLESRITKDVKTGTRKMIDAFMDEFEAAIKAEMNNPKKPDVPIQGFLELPGQNAALADRARNQARAEQARQDRRNAKTDLERRRAANRERRARERAEKGLGTETDVRRFNRTIGARGNRAIDKFSEVQGIDPNEIKNSLSMILPAVLSGGTIANMMTPVVGAVIPAIIPMLPSIIAGIGLKRLITPVIREAERALMVVEPLKQRLNLVGNEGGTGVGGEAELDFVKGVSREFGIDLETAAQQYGQLALAARRTRLEGEPIRELFKGIAASLAAQKTPAGDASLVLNAYSQMVSKGKISMEELRQQLGEKFPLAMGVFADALNVTIPELNRLVSSGSLLSEDVLPKVAKVLQSDFTDAAKTAAGGYISAVNRVNSARFEFAENFGEAYGALPTLLKRGEAALVNAANDNFQVVSNAINTGIISLVATVGTAVTTIMNTGMVSDVSTKIANFTKQAFTSGMMSVTPFLMVAFADLLDDVFDVGTNPSGKQGTFLNNMVDGFTNMFFVPIDNLRTFMNQGLNSEFVTGTEAVPTLLKNIGQNLKDLVPDVVVQKVSGLADTLKSLFDRVGGGVIQLGVMYIMFQQIGALAGGFLNPQIAKLGFVLKSYGETLRATLLSGEGLKNLWNNINITTGALFNKDLKSIAKNFNLATVSAKAFSATTATLKAGGAIIKAFSGEIIMLAAAYAMLAFSKSDTRMTLVEDIDKAVTRARAGVRDLKLALEDLRNTPGLDEPEPRGGRSQFTAKGYELDPLKLFSEEGFKSDQLELNRRAGLRNTLDQRSVPGYFNITSSDRSMLGTAENIRRALTDWDSMTKAMESDDSFTYHRSIKLFGDTLAEVGIQAENFFNPLSRHLTRTEKHFLNTAKGSQALKNSLDAIMAEGFTAENILSGNMPEEYTAVMEGIQEVDAEIKALQERRVELGLLDTDESKNQIGEIDEQIRAKLKERSELQLTIGFMPAQVNRTVKDLEATLKALEADVDFPLDKKKPLLLFLNKQLLRAKEIQDAINNSELKGLLAPPEEPWTRLNRELAETVRLFDVASSAAKVDDLERQSAAVTALLNQDRGDRDSFTPTIEQGRNRIEGLQEQLDLSNKLLAERQRKLRELLTVTDTERNPEMRKEIENLKKQIRTDQEKVARFNLDINKQRRSILKAEEKLVASQRKAFQARSELGIAREFGLLNLDALNSDINTNRIKLNRSLLGLDTSFVGIGDKLRTTIGKLALTQKQQGTKFESILTSFDGNTLNWFLSKLERPVSSFGEALTSVTTEELANIKQSLESNLSNNPIGAELFRQVEAFAKLRGQSLKLEADALAQRTDIVNKLRQAFEALRDFNNQVANKIKDAVAELSNLKLDLLSKKIENSILSQLTPGTSGVFREFGNFLTTTLQNLVGGEQSTLTLQEEARANAKELKGLRENYAELNLKLRDAVDAYNATFIAYAQANEALINSTDVVNNFSDALTKATENVGNIGQDIDTETVGNIGQDIATEVNPSTNTTTTDQVPTTAQSSLFSALEKQRQEIINAVTTIDTKRQSFSDSSKSISDLAYGVGFDPSRFEGSIPGVTPENNAQTWDQIQMTLRDSRDVLMAQTDAIANMVTNGIDINDVDIPNMATEGITINATDVSSILKTSPEKPQLTNASIEKLGTVLNDQINTKQEIQTEETNTALLNAQDQAAQALNTMRDNLVQFGQSIMQARNSVISMADEFGVGTLFGRGESAGTQQVNTELESVRTIKRQLFDSIGKDIGDADILSQSISDDDIKGIDVSRFDTSELSKIDSFQPIIEKYKAGTINFAEAVQEMAGETDAVANELTRLLPLIQQSEKFNKRIEDRGRLLNLGQGFAGLAQNRPFANEMEANQANRAVELYDNETKRLEATKELERLRNKGLLTEDQYIERLSLTNTLYASQAEIISHNNSLMADLGESIRDNLTGAFKNVIMEGKNVFESLRGFAVGILDDIASKAIDIASNAIVSGLFGGIGGGSGGFAGLIGGLFGGGFNMGGKVASYNTGGEVGMAAVTNALKQESGTPVLAALHVGEQVLTDINGDAQYFRSLKASGAWDKMKNTSSYNYGGMVNSYNAGGNVQNRPTENKFSKMQSGNNTVVMNISTPDVGGFKRNEKQLLRRQQEMLNRSKRRYG